jgi:hypothetical protein
MEENPFGIFLITLLICLAILFVLIMLIDLGRRIYQKWRKPKINKTESEMDNL